jgi:hypothetical protein
MTRSRQVKSRTRSSRSHGSSAAQVAANRANAQASTGPRTPEGKARVSQNAVKHGLYSRRTMERLAGRENAGLRAEYDAHLEGLQAYWQPQGEAEETLVDRLADQDWRLANLRNEKDLYLDDQRALYEFRPHEVNPRLLHDADLFCREEGRLERSLNTLQRNLLHLRRWRPGKSKPVFPDLSAFFPPRPARPPEKPPVQPDPETVSEFADEPSTDPGVPFPPPGEIVISDQHSIEEVEKQSQRAGNYRNGAWIGPPEAT